MLKGTEIDLVREGVNEVVKFNNPNVVAECGCGESFSVS
jgi:Fe-S cluster assembly protein SufA/iron-sulfur cluster assembly protein